MKLFDRRKGRCGGVWVSELVNVLLACCKLYLFLVNSAIGYINKVLKCAKGTTCGFVFDLLS